MNKIHTVNHNVEDAVLDRYQKAAHSPEPGLCCPIDYDPVSLDILPKEVIEKDYGCGNPSTYVNEGETVIDLGSGTGKICYILAHKVGTQGQVIGVDFNDDMLQIARKYQDEMAGKLGFANVRFVKGKIQDLALDLDKVQHSLSNKPINSIDKLSSLEHEMQRLRNEEPMIPDNSVDVVVSNCVLNLVRPEDKQKLFNEIFRVLKRGGRAVISDIVSDEDPTPSILNDPDLWSGCIAGAFREDQFLQMFEDAGFYGVEILNRQVEPWQVIDGIEFRSMTVRAYKGKEGPCMEHNQAVVYKGPWKKVTDDDGHVFHRGKRAAVCEKTFKIMTDPTGPYHQQMVPIEPYEAIEPENAITFDCNRRTERHPRETKGQHYRETVQSDGSPCDCGPTCC